MSDESNVVSLADRRAGSDGWWSGPAVCVGCGMLARVVVPLPLEAAELLCFHCEERGDVHLVDLELSGAFVVYDAPRADPVLEDVESDAPELELVDNQPMPGEGATEENTMQTEKVEILIDGQVVKTVDVELPRDKPYAVRVRDKAGKVEMSMSTSARKRDKG